MPNKRKPHNSRHSNSRKRKSDTATSRKHTHQSRLQQRLLSFLRANRHQSFTCKEIAAETELWKQLTNNKVRKLMDDLAAQGEVAYEGQGRYRYMGEGKTLAGQVQVTRSGVGFLLMEEGEDVFISPSNLGKAMNGDQVRVRLLSRRSREGKREGEVIEIVHRARTHFVGTVEEAMPGRFFLLPDDPRLNLDFAIAKGKHRDARHGQKVLARLISWDDRVPVVEVETVLGNAGEHDTEMHAILLQYDFQPDFPAEVEAEAAEIPSKITAKEIAARRDMREVTTFTIDPSDAKDFDDALSLRVLENGRYEVGVHIADVSYYVKPGTALDKEAFQRATSVYLVDRTVPMLPEKLSNEVCSLRPQEESLTYSAIFELDDEAHVHRYWIGRTVIYSDHRFDYDQAQAVIEGQAEGPFATELHTLHRLAQKLRERRFATGSIEFESEEVKFILDENDKPIGVKRKVMKDSNHLIEDFMLLANRTVATHIFKLRDNPALPSVYRIHDRPDPEKLAGLAEFAAKLGHKVDFEAKGDLSTRLNQLLREVEGKPEQHVVSTIAVRSMAKAIYSTKNVGHFGLGFPYYTHFTSPIRRYPDLMIHRLLTAYGEGHFRENPTVMEAQLKHCSEKERTATEAERASIRYKQVEFLSDKIGQAFEGLISGVIESGFFVELEETLCEGFVPVARLDDDYYVFDQQRYALIGRDTGQVLQIGHRVRVTITSTDMQRRQVEMALVEKLPAAG